MKKMSSFLLLATFSTLILSNTTFATPKSKHSATCAYSADSEPVIPAKVSHLI